MAGLKIKNGARHQILIAPMSGCTDLSFRLIAREFGAKFCFFEMLDAKALTYQHATTLTLLKTIPKDKPIAAQLLGADPSVMLDAANRLLSAVDISFLDINSACPVKKVIKKRAGAYLLQDTKRLSEIIKKLSSSLPVPVTVKIRTGYDKHNPKEIIDTAKICRDSGASMIFVHGRTKSQGYAGEVDYASIKAVKDNVDIPVFGSGNILNAQSAKRMFDETGCDGILVARGALGYPWIFKEIETYLKSGKIAKAPTLNIKKKILKKHLSYILKYKNGVKLGLSPFLHSSCIGVMRKVAMWYLRGVPDAAKVRENICKAKLYDELLDSIDGA